MKLLKLVDLVGIEPTTSSMPWKRAPSCATGPLSEGTAPDIPALYSFSRSRNASSNLADDICPILHAVSPGDPAGRWQGLVVVCRQTQHYPLFHDLRIFLAVGTISGPPGSNRVRRTARESIFSMPHGWAEFPGAGAQTEIAFRRLSKPLRFDSIRETP